MPVGECVGDADLRAFLLGDLTEDRARAVGGHVETCARCEAAARRMDGMTDPLIRSLQRALAPGTDRNTPAGGEAEDRGDADTWPAVGQSQPDLLPQRVAGYELLEELGRGGMGVVYKARQLSPSRVVALKMILAGEYSHPARRARFLAE